MSSEYAALAVEIHQIAVAHCWEQTERISIQIQDDTQDIPLLIATLPQMEIAPLTHWIDIQGQPTGIVQPLQGIEETRLSALLAQRVLIAIPCGQLLDFQDVSVIEWLIQHRGTGPYAFVLTQVEQMADPETLDRSLKGFWRLFIPEPKPDWNGQDLLAYRVFLWSAVTPPPFLADRVKRDSLALADWLKSPLPPAYLGKIRALNYLMEVAEDEAEEEKTHPVPTPVPSHALDAIRETIASLRRRLHDRFDNDALRVERQLTTSLQTLEQNLLKDLPNALHKVGESPRISASENLQKELVRFVQNGAQRWREDAEVLIRQSELQFTQETDALLQTVNWQEINDLLRQNGSNKTFPDALLCDLTWSLGSFQFLLQNENTLKSVPFAPLADNSFQIAAACAAVLAVGGFLLGLGPIGIAAGIIGGALGGTLVRQRVHQKQVHYKSEQIGSDVIIAVMREASSQVRHQTYQAFLPLHKNLDISLDELDAFIRTLQIRASTPSIEPQNTHQILRDLQTRVVELAQSASA